MVSGSIIIVASHLFMLSALLPTDDNILLESSVSITILMDEYATKLSDNNPNMMIGIIHNNNFFLKRSRSEMNAGWMLQSHCMLKRF